METGRGRLAALKAHLDASLFPAPAPGRQAFSRWETALLTASFLALAVVLELARPGWSGSLHSLWAEDGSVFLQESLVHSAGETVFNPYANYLVLVPRLIGEAATLAPLPDAPAAISILSATVVASSGLVVWHASAGHIRNPYLRGTLALLTVLVPVGGLEAVDSASNVSWYMLFATFWILLWRPPGNRRCGVAALFVLATALSNPGVWFLAPLAALRALVVRDRRDLAIVAAFWGGAAVQVPVLLSHHAETSPHWTHDIWTVYLQRVVDGVPLGLGLGGDAWSAIGWPLPIGLSVCALAGIAVGAWRSTPGPRFFAAIAVATSLGMFVGSLYQRAVGTVMVWPEGSSNEVGGRYAIVPALLLASVALVLLDTSLRRDGPPRRFTWPAGAAVAVLLFAIGTSFYVGDLVVRGMPPWEASLRAAADACVTERREIVAIQTSPPGFAVPLPCDRISSFADPQPAPGSGRIALPPQAAALAKQGR
jgi:hypothetical protein